MMRNKVLVAAGAALALFVADSAFASIVTTTYSGQVTNGYDQTGVFGPPGTNLTGAFTAKFIFDTKDALAYVDNDPVYPSHGIEVSGAYPNSPSLGAWLTINGTTFALAGDHRARAYTTSYDDGYTDHSAYAADNLDQRDGSGFGFRSEASLYMYAGGYTNPYYGLNNNLDFDVPDDADATGDFFVGSFFSLPYGTNGVETHTLTYALGNVKTTHFTQTVSSVPEPATWAMMLGGFGMVGFALRKRRKVSLANA